MSLPEAIMLSSPLRHPIPGAINKTGGINAPAAMKPPISPLRFALKAQTAIQPIFFAGNPARPAIDLQ
ncbi:MAG: hypothetical protein KGN34_11635 [Sphingomonadales bacterium]|nr:hypothetical protein [Sphingomonadales bacterium]